MRLISDFALAVVTVYQEARGEPMVGKIAVGEVIRNRMKATGKGVAQTVLQPLAFSGWNSHDPNRIPSVIIEDTDPVVTECAQAWLESETSDLVNGALNYWNPKMAAPSWADQIDNPIQIGNHLFGTPPPVQST